MNPRRTRPGFGAPPPADPKAHGAKLRDELDDTLATPVFEAGFDPRRLLKLIVDGLEPTDLESIPGLQVVSQEDKTIVVLFATDEGRAEFRRRLQILAQGKIPSRKEIFWAVRGIDDWGPKDRIGGALRREGVPHTERFVLDVELWPLERRHSSERSAMLAKFAEWCDRAGARVLDRVDQEGIILVRVELTEAVYKRLLQHRDVRLVDLPPKLRLLESDIQVDIAAVPPVPMPPATAPLIGVLDSGVAANHPVLAPAMGDAQSFLPGLPAHDGHGHGTAVAGLALYGDVLGCIEGAGFAPRLRLLSGRITDDAAGADAQFLENRITTAVDYFLESYGCRIFNLSLGDHRKPYSGGHVRGLAVTLDTLSRTRDVLFIVSAGNYFGDDEEDDPDWKAQYPRYLLDREMARIVDPAPALNVLTVGALARFEQSRAAQRHPTDPAYQPIARNDQPSPFTRTGPGPGGALKPDLVFYGGNIAVDVRAGTLHKMNALLGEPAPDREFASGRLFRDWVGTSFAAPQVAHLAGRVLAEYPRASSNLLRALIVAHASIPAPAEEVTNDEKDLRRLLGYGRPSFERCIYSSQSRVSLQAEDQIGEDEHHFYEVPLPADFLSEGRRDRAITVALAHMPFVRTTRADYRASTMSFRVVAEDTLDAVTRVFRKTPKEDREDAIPEFRKPSLGPNVRDKGTVQAATYEVKQLTAASREKRLFAVVTRSVPAWARGWVDKEPYAIVVVVEDRADQRVRYYQQIVEIQQRLRGRARV